MVEVESAEKVARRTSRRRACNDKHGVTGDDTERSRRRVEVESTKKVARRTHCRQACNDSMM